MVKHLLTKFALLAVMLVGVGSAWADTVTDVLNRELTGISNGGGYGSWEGKSSNSDAVYAGQSAGGNDAIQLRTTNNNSGVVTTTSGGKVRKVTVTWGSQTTSGRTLNVYGKNTAYTAASDLHNTSNQGTLLGTIVKGTSTELSVSGDYEYIGFRSNSGALYLSEVKIDWEVSGSGKSNPELSFGTTTEFTCDLFGAFTAPTLTSASGYDGTISYESSDVNVAEVDDDGTVTINAVGTTTITATGTATSTFNDGSASYTLTVTENEGQSVVTPISGKYVKVTSTADITDGQYLIVYENENGSVAFNGGLETLDAVGNTIEVTISNNEIAATTTTKDAEFTLDVTDGTLLSASGKYIGVSSNSNGLKATEDADTYTHDFSIDENGNAVIKAAFDESTMTLRYNSASDQTRFRYYKSGQKAIQLYKYVAGTSSDTKKITLSSYGYKTLVASKNFTVSGATAYIVTAATGSGITTTSLNVVPANEPVFLKGKANATATLTFTEDDADDASANQLAISAASTNYNGDYVLASKNNDAVGFYKWNGGTLGAGRVYLPAANVNNNPARSFLPFVSDEATGIASAKVSQSKEQVYDLQGRRVAQPTKGLYIVNGKKMILK